MSREATSGKMYVGSFPRTMDAKNRVTIPSEFPIKEGELLYIFPERHSRYLNVMPEVEFARQEDVLKERLESKTKGWRSIIRDIFGSAREVRTDKQGRILIPDEFCKAVGLNPTVTCVAVKNSFEIWDAAKRAEVLAQEKQSLTPEAEEILDDLGL
jgi:MraZ protein